MYSIELFRLSQNVTAVEMQIPRLVRVLRRQVHSSADHGTINPSEIAHFSRLSSKWWDEQGEFSFLHKMNPVRVQFIRQKLLEIFRERDGEHVVPSQVLHGLDVLDVGCGGGLLSEVCSMTPLQLSLNIQSRVLPVSEPRRRESMRRNPMSQLPSCMLQPTRNCHSFPTSIHRQSHFLHCPNATTSFVRWKF